MNGSTTPSATIHNINCHIIEQVISTPYTITQLNLPETFSNGRTYQIQFGRKLNFAAAGNQTVSLRVPAGMFNNVQLDALVSSLVTDATLTLDIGDDGSNDWSGTVDNNSTLLTVAPIR